MKWTRYTKMLPNVVAGLTKPVHLDSNVKPAIKVLEKNNVRWRVREEDGVYMGVKQVLCCVEANVDDLEAAGMRYKSADELVEMGYNVKVVR